MIVPDDLELWAVRERGEAYLKRLFPNLDNGAHRYTGFGIVTTSLVGKIECLVYRFEVDRRAILSRETLIEVTEDKDVFPSNELIAQIALVVG